MPGREKLVLPKGYGRTTKMISWESVRDRLAEAKQYWLATNRGSGSPHLVPVDGLWVDDRLYYGGSPETVHVRLAQANPNVTIHLPDPWQVVVVEGEVRVSTTSPGLAQRLADVANVKYAEYGMQHDASAYAEPAVVHPRRVIAWSTFPKDATRFTFTG